MLIEMRRDEMWRLCIWDGMTLDRDEICIDSVVLD